jgi:hypothetical protein
MLVDQATEPSWQQQLWSDAWPMVAEEEGCMRLSGIGSFAQAGRQQGLHQASSPPAGCDHWRGKLQTHAQQAVGL